MSSAPTSCLIVDDEALSHLVLIQFIAQMPGLTLCGKCRNAMEAHDRSSRQKAGFCFRIYN